MNTLIWMVIGTAILGPAAIPLVGVPWLFYVTWRGNDDRG